MEGPPAPIGGSFAAARSRLLRISLYRGSYRCSPLVFAQYDISLQPAPIASLKGPFGAARSRLRNMTLYCSPLVFDFFTAARSCLLKHKKKAIFIKKIK